MRTDLLLVPHQFLEKNFIQIFKFSDLTLFQVGLKIYVSWWGGAFKAPPMFSLKMTYLGPKNNKTIIPHIFEDLMEGLEPKHPPLAPKKPTFLKISKFPHFLRCRKK